MQLSPSNCGGGAGTKHTAPLDACGRAMLIVAAGAVDGALCLACSGDSSGAVLHEPRVAACSDAWHGLRLPPRSYARTGAAVVVRAVGDRGSHQWDFVFWLWLELHHSFVKKKKKNQQPTYYFFFLPFFFLTHCGITPGI